MQIWANLPVEDVERTREFYTKLGFRLNEGRNGEQLASFIVGEDDFVVHFFHRDMYEKASGGKIADLSQGSEVMFTLSADSRDEVDQWAEKVRQAGGTLFSDPREGPGEMYGCGFSGPDGHKWNVFYNGG